MTIQSCWVPKLKSIKFEFDTSQASRVERDHVSPQHVVIPNPLASDIPGLPSTIHIHPPHSDGPRGASTGKTESHEAATHQPPAAVLPPQETPGFHPHEYIIGASCAMPSQTPRIDLVAAVSTAWALLLSHQLDSLDADFALSLSEVGFEPHPVSVSLGPERLVSHVRRDLAARASQVDDLSGGAACHRRPCVGEHTKTTLRSALEFRSANAVRGRLQYSDYHLVLVCSIQASGTDVDLSACFDDRFVDRRLVYYLLSDLEHVLWQIMGAPEDSASRLGELETVGPLTQRAMIRLNRPVPPRSDTPFHHQVALRAAERPDSRAVEAWDGVLTYSELEALSDDLAQHLCQLGVSRESLVPILFEKSRLSIVAMLAVVKAGGAIVPMDPTAPLSRLHNMVEEVDASVAICSVRNRGKAGSAVKEVTLDMGLLSSLSSSRTGKPPVPPLAPSPDNALYVIFTSGSTGKPKGVVVTHGAFSSGIAAFRDPILLSSPRRRVLHYASPSFDASILETLVPLTIGACICIPSDSARLDDLARCVNQLGVNFALLTPQVAKLLRPQEVPRLEVLCLGGEPLPRDLVDVWADHVKLFNLYGPSEATIMCTINGPIQSHQDTVSLGRPRGCAVWIVNKAGDRVQSFNTVGEIAVEGPIIARGYLGDEEKTAAAFGNSAEFLGSVASSARFYRTGDLGRIKVDGTIDFLGRRDGQVKINGQRIELGEIEHHVKRALDDIAPSSTLDAVVDTFQPPWGGKVVLAAFIGSIEQSEHGSGRVLLDPKTPMSIDIFQKTERLQNSLAKHLPQYMIPNVVLPCAGIPRSSSGKVDRRRLQDVASALSVDEFRCLQNLSYAARCPAKEDGESFWPTDSSDGMFPDDDARDGSATPSMSISSAQPSCSSGLLTPPAELATREVLLRSIWADILHITEESISPEDDFLKLGGDSIAIIKIVAACRRRGIHASVAAVSNHPKLTDMARACQTIGDGLEAASLTDRDKSGLDAETWASSRIEAAKQCRLHPDCIDDVYPCTLMQEELAVADMIHPGVSVGRFIHKLPADIDLARFRAAWESVWETSPVLRTRFVNTASAGSLQAVVRQDLPWLRARGLQAYLEADDASPMPPGSCLTRLAVVVDVDECAYFVWSMHHMLYDGWSIPLVCQRVNAVYHGIDVEPVTDFRPFVAFSKSLDQDRTAAYWEKILDHVAPSTFPVPVAPQTSCLAQSKYKARLELPTTGSVLQACGFTLPTVVQAAWAMMIGDRCKTDDVLFGVTVSGRSASLESIESVEGPTLATVPVRLRPRLDCTAIGFLRSVQDHMSALIPNEQFGLKNISAINRHTKRGCEFQNILVVQAGAAWGDAEGPLGEPLHEGENATLPLLCQVWLLPGTADFDVVFDGSLVSLEAVQDAIKATQLAIMQLLVLTDSSPEKLAQIRLREETSTNPSSLNSKPAGGVDAVEETIHDLISAMEAKQGLGEAVCSSTDSLSYHSLCDLSTRLAIHLTSLSICRGEIVPLCFEKSVWTVVAMLAVLKSGAAFVLLDPSQPEKRLEDLLLQVDARVVILSPGQDKVVGSDHALERVVVSPSFLDALPLETPARQLPRVPPRDLAYMIFTSGSTGEPKGVMISHSALASSAAAYREALQLKPTRRVLQFSSYCFDASINETLVVLMSGGTVCVASEEERVADLAGFIRRHRVDWAILTPSVARILSPVDTPGLETLDLGGEAPDQALLSKWHKAGVRVFNVYGPAEGAGTAFCQRYRQGLDSRTIGSPMGCRAWIVNRHCHDELAFDGQIGELLLEGPILASGYFKDHRKTARSFILDPQWAVAPQNSSSGPRRMYKTGDLCFRKNGVMVYVGRKDSQVKVHGQRIELGDIEAHLATCDGIRQCAVFYPAGGPFKHELTAVFELDGRDTVAREALLPSLRGQLSTKVPGAMIPTRWVNASTILGQHTSFPLSPSGKVDRRLLAAILNELPENHAEVCDSPAHDGATRTSQGGRIWSGEQPAYRLAEAIYGMLPRKRDIGSHGPGEENSCERGFDDLFLQSSGLDSLNMMSLMYLISRQYHVTVNIQLLMEKTMTIRKLAKWVCNAQSRAGVSDDQAILSPTTVDIMAEIRRHDSVISSFEERRVAQLQPKAGIAEKGGSGTTMVKRLTVLLTGANGFVGTQILRQLLENAVVEKVIAVVRGEDEAAARKRTIDASTKARWWTDLHGEKLEVWRGDLSLGGLGLGPQRWEYLESGQVDAIIHNGAVVNWTASFAALEATNVNSTVELLGLAAANPWMRFVYVSGGRDRGPGEEGEEDVARDLSAPHANGYSQSKFVAEAVVRRTALRCGSKSEMRRFAIVSPGLVIGTPTEGVANRDDYIWRLAAAAIKVGAYNGDQEDAWVDMSDAAALASIIADAALGVKVDQDGCGTEAPVARDVTDGMTWGEFWALVAGMGYRLEPRGASDWLAAVRGDIERCQETHPLWPLAHMLESQASEQPGSRRGETPLRLRVAVRRNAAFLADAGFLPRPERGAWEEEEREEATQGGCFSRSGL